jgi:riboflavin synthase
LFTGLIEEIGEVKGVERTGTGVLLTVGSRLVLEDTKIGDSISIDGACQTVTDIGKDCFTVFASKVTCSVTTLGDFKTGRRVNLERALTASSRLGGHLVQGHVDGKGKIRRIKNDKNGLEIEIHVDESDLRYVVERGSVSVDGVSLTVVSLAKDSFAVYIIPETIIKTTLSEKAIGDEVNIETDILAKYVEKMLSSGNDSINADRSLKNKLIEEGFI